MFELIAYSTDIAQVEVEFGAVRNQIAEVRTRLDAGCPVRDSPVPHEIERIGITTNENATVPAVVLIRNCMQVLFVWNAKKRAETFYELFGVKKRIIVTQSMPSFHTLTLRINDFHRVLVE